ncbi:ABC transporter ATP-binding protein [Salipaludibacillus daqingensis]|uniref:ABC transporter ATP-binding protein n=1 Tax=Salipaludibacillus daqingensis TaxID=3041001 RepID=UPI002474FAB9|nr:ABC transporter ATP-binding protein [Salipaludibacillus daqingensis]
MIEFKNVSKDFPDGTKAVKNVSFKVNEGEMFVIIGPSGCGKTTTMKMINRLIDSSEGKILIENKNILDMNIKKLRWNIGYVLQQIALFPHMTIEENISIVPELKKWSKEETHKRVNELLNMVGLDPDTYRDRIPSELSGGQQQRIGVVRALAGNPDIILMDEPFSALDPISREQLQGDIVKLQKEIKKTIVFVTHDMDEALALGNRICVMKDGGVVQIDDPATLLRNPTDEFVREFLGDRKDPWSELVSELFPLTEKEIPPAYDASSSLSASATVKEALDKLKKVDDDSIAIFENNDYRGHLSYRDITLYLEKNRVKTKGGARS